MSWSARQYLAFESERTRPARDLLAGIPAKQVGCGVDLGCGPGNSTELLAARFPGSRIAGLDSSAAMVAAARKRLPALQFEVLDLREWAVRPLDTDGALDVIFANAVLQWVPDHAALLPALVAKLTRGGALAFQMPDNLHEPAQTAMRAIAAADRWRGKLAEAAGLRVPVEAAGWYYDRLRESCSYVDVWRTTYHHPLRSPDAVVEWFSGTGLLPYLEHLDADERADFLARYRKAIEQGYPRRSDGAVLLPFPRLFVVAVR